MFSRSSKRGNPLRLSLSTSRRQLHRPSMRKIMAFNDRLARRAHTEAIRVSIRQRINTSLKRRVRGSTRRRSTTNITLSKSPKIARVLTIIMIVNGMSNNSINTRERSEWSQRLKKVMVEVATIKVMVIKITGRGIIKREVSSIKRGISSTRRANKMKNKIKNTTKSSNNTSTMMKRSMKITMRVALRSRSNKLLRSSILNRITPIPQVEGQYLWTWSLLNLNLCLNLNKLKNQNIILKQRISSLSLKFKNSGQLLSNIRKLRTTLPRNLSFKTSYLPPNLSSPTIKYKCHLTSSRHSPTSSSQPTMAMPHKRRQFSSQHPHQQPGLSFQIKEHNSQLMHLLKAINSRNLDKSRRLHSTLESKTLTVSLLPQHSTTNSMWHLQVLFLVARSSDN
jgi:hypothetical protein